MQDQPDESGKEEPAQKADSGIFIILLETGSAFHSQSVDLAPASQPVSS